MRWVIVSLKSVLSSRIPNLESSRDVLRCRLLRSFCRDTLELALSAGSARVHGDGFG